VIYLDESLPNHPKIVRAGQLIGGKDGVLVAVGLFVTAIAYARRLVTDGVVPTVMLDTYPRRAAGSLSPLAALTKVGLLEKRGHDYIVHDYHHWNPSAAKIKTLREKARIRKAKWRDSHDDVTVGQPRDASGTDRGPSEPRMDMIHDPRSPIPCTEGERTGEPPFDVWFRELVAAYPEQGRTNSHLTETAFLTVFERDRRDPDVVYAELRDALENHKRSHQWRVKGMVSRLDNWLRDGKYAQRLSEAGPTSRADKSPAWLQKAKATTP
jgi:hypothetical protein